MRGGSEELGSEELGSEGVGSEGVGSEGESGGESAILGLIATGFGRSPRWVAERDDRDHRDNRDGLWGRSCVTFGLFQERLCDVLVVSVVSVVSIWRWIRSAVCQLSEPRAAAISAGYEVLSARRVNLDQQNSGIQSHCRFSPSPPANL